VGWTFEFREALSQDVVDTVKLVGAEISVIDRRKKTDLLGRLIRYIMGENLTWSLNSVTSFTSTECGIAVLPLLLITTMVILIFTRHGRRIYVAIVTLPRDIR